VSRFTPPGYERDKPITLVTTDPSAPPPITDAPKPKGFFDAFGHAWRDGIIYEGARSAFEPSFTPDPNWNPKSADIDAVTEGVDEDLWYKYGQAVSADHLYSIYVSNLSRMERRKTIEEAGFSGQMARLTADLLDPGMFLIGVGTAGIGTGMRAVTTAERLRKYAALGLVNGAAMAGGEAFRYSRNPDFTATDVATAALGGFGGGAASAYAGINRLGIAGTGAAVGGGMAAGTAAGGIITGQEIDDVIAGAGFAFLFGGATGAGGRALFGEAQMDSVREITERSQVFDILRSAYGYEPFMPRNFLTEPMFATTYDTMLNGPDGVLAPAAARSRSPLTSLPTSERTNPGFFSGGESGATNPNRLAAFGLGDAVIPNPANQSLPSRLVPFSDELGISRLRMFGGTLTTDAPQVSRRQQIIAKQKTVSADEQARLDSLERLFPGASELQTQAQETTARTLRETVGIARGEGSIDFVKASDIDPLFADTLGVPLEQLAADLNRVLTPDGYERFRYTFGRERMEQKRLQAAEIIEALDDDLPTGVVPVFSDEIVALSSAELERLKNATTDLAQAADPAPVMGAAGPNDPAFSYRKPTTALPNLKSGMFLIHETTDGVPWKKEVRKWTTLRAMNVVGASSLNGHARRVMNALAFQPIPLVDSQTGKVIGVATAGGRWAVSHSNGMDAEFEASMIGPYQQHRQMGGTLSESDFYIAVTKAKRRAGRPEVAEFEKIPGVKEAVKYLHQNAFDAGATVQLRHGVDGADVAQADNYATREWLQHKMRQWEKKIGSEQVLEGIARAYLKSNPDDPPEIAALVARYIRKNGGRHEYRHPGVDMLDGELEIVLAGMKDQGEKDELVKLFKQRVSARKGQKGKPTNLRTRIELDETFVHEATVNGQTVRMPIEELLENNAMVLGKKYIRRAHGSVVHKEVMRMASEMAGVEISTIDQLKAFLDSTAPSSMSDTARSWDKLRIEAMYREAVGIPRVTDSAFLPIARVSRMLRSALSSTLLSSHYYTATNVGEPTTHLVTNIRSAAKSLIPAASELTQRAADGKLSSKNAAMFEFMTGRGSTGLTSRTHVVESPMEGTDAALAALEGFVDKAGRFASRLTGAQQTQDYFYRVMGDVIQNDFGTWVLSGKRPNAAILAEFGWTPEQFDRIAAAARPHITTEKGQFGAKIHILNQEKWSAEAFSEFEAGVWSYLDSAFTNPGSEARSWFQNHEAGRFMFQFRDFIVFASDAKWGKTAFAYMEGDKAVAASRTAARFMAGVLYSYGLYVAAVYLKSLGRPDAEEYRRERLDDGKAWVVAVGRTSYSSVVPMSVDAILSSVGVDPVFAQGRASGISGGGLDSIPVVDFYKKSVPAIGRMVRRPFVEDEDLSVQDVMNATRGIPFFLQYEPLTKATEYFARNVLKLPETPKE
jgi:hypothetical protein